MPVLKMKNKETGEWEQVGVSVEVTATQIVAQIDAHNVATDAHADIRQLIAERVQIFHATIGTAWEEDAETGVFSQSVSIPGVLETHTAKVAHEYNGDYTAASYTAFVEAENQYIDCIKNGFSKTYNGGIKFYSFGDPNTVEIPIVVEVV